MKEHYKIYLEIYGKIQSGTKLTKRDYGFINSNGGFEEYDEKGMLAVSTAAQDVKTGAAIRAKNEFEEYIKNLLSQ